ncbi:MAG TPA: methylmalonyl-CoA mutase family protein [Bacteroidales bacterium]|nr:methylmalonyl-CoA mutase family protein [Bacteroidales bacterium]
MMVKKEKLFGKFPPVSTEEWMNKIHSDLKGADFSRKLVWKTNEGFDVMPFYRNADIADLWFKDTLPGEFPYVRGTKKKDNSWLIRQDIRVEDYDESNKKALDILMRGVDSIGFIIVNPETINNSNFKRLLDKIHPEAVELNFLSNGKAVEILESLSAVLSERGLDNTVLRGAVEADPLVRLLSNGTLCIPPGKGFDYLAGLTSKALEFPHFRTVHIKASHFGNAGADIVQELAFALSAGNEYMSRLTDRKTDPLHAAGKIRFSFGVGSNYFFEIAKLRAARLLWSAVLRGYINKGVVPGMEMHCTTSGWNKTAYDPYVNILRTQTEAMAAILGGTNSLTVEPFDISFRQPDAFSERIARNQQLILKDEAHFDKVADPAAGSYYIEKLTEELADKAWKLFIEVEQEGGFLSAITKGTLQERISASASRRKKEVSTRKAVLLGTNQYPRPGETLPPDADLSVMFDHKAPAGTEVNPVNAFRGSAEYEKLRMAVEKAGKQPVVFLFTTGNPAMSKARAQFSAGFFGCAGYRVIDNQGFSSLEGGVVAALGSGADIVVICSSDEEYASVAPEIFKNLKDHAIVVIAGNPCCADELRSAGIENFIHIKTDVIETLKYFNLKLGITKN